MDFSTVRLADAVIEKMVLERGRLTLKYKDWQENQLEMSFDEAIAIEAYSPEGVDLSHGRELEEDPLIFRARQLVEIEQIADYRCFGIWSAWSDDAVLKVVARTFSVCAISVLRNNSIRSS